LRKINKPKYMLMRFQQDSMPGLYQIPLGGKLYLLNGIMRSGNRQEQMQRFILRDTKNYSVIFSPQKNRTEQKGEIETLKYTMLAFHQES
jgi:hypothetical protein